MYNKGMVSSVQNAKIYNFRIPPKKLENNPVQAIEDVSSKIQTAVADISSAGYNAAGFAVAVALSKTGLPNQQFEKYFSGLIEESAPNYRVSSSVYSYNEDKLIFQVHSL
jgi:hypothetical protein